MPVCTDDAFDKAQDTYIARIDEPGYAKRVGEIQEQHMRQHGSDLLDAFVFAVDMVESMQ